MACMEHQCRACGHTWFDNSSSGTCPKCGSMDSLKFWDEQYSYDGEDG